MLAVESRVAVGDALRGLEVAGLPKGWTPVETVCIVKCLEPDADHFGFVACPRA